MMEQRFSQSGQRALVWAYQAAKRLGHGAIGPEHLLLGALHEEDGALALQAEEVVVRLMDRQQDRDAPTALTEQGAAVIQQAAALAAPHGGCCWRCCRIPPARARTSCAGAVPRAMPCAAGCRSVPVPPGTAPAGS